MTLSPSIHSADDRAFDHHSFDQPVPRSIVHKSGPGEVIVTDSRQISERTYLVAAELPRAHAFFGDTTGGTPGVDVVTGLEYARQSCYVVLHRYLGVPLDSAVAIRDVRVELDAGADRLRLDGPVPMLCAVELIEPVHRHGALTGYHMTFRQFTFAGDELARVTTCISWAPPPTFAKVRGARRSSLGLPPKPSGIAWAGESRPTIAPGRRSAANGVLADYADDGDTASAFLRPDLAYPALFDHDYDHLPGIVQVEGCKQLALWGAARRLGVEVDDLWVREFAVEFRAFTELDLHTQCTATFSPNPDGPGLAATVSTAQNGSDLGEMRLVLLPR